MTAKVQAPPLQSIRPVWIIVIFSMSLFFAFGLGAFIFDLYTGTCMFVFPIYFCFAIGGAWSVWVFLG